MQRRWAERIGIAERLKRGVLMASFGAGGMSRNWASRIDRFEVGGTTLDHVIARYAEDQRGAFTSRTEAGNIGTQVLANFVIDFDYRQGRMSWRRVPGYVPPPLNRAGFRARKDRPEDFRVVLVSDGSPGARAGIHVDDRIVGIAGAPAPTLSGADFNEIFARAPGTHVVVDLLRDGQPVRADVVLEEALP